MEDIDEYANTLGFEEDSYLDLFQAVMKLDKKYRVPILLFYYEDYSTADMHFFSQMNSVLVLKMIKSI